MKNLFNLENPIFEFLFRVADLMIANVLFVLCCLPVFTIGASICALQKVTQNIVFDDDSPIVKTFFQAFRSNFKQATGVWLVVMVVIVSLICDFILILAYFRGTAATILYILLAILAILVSGVLAFMLPMIVRYQNSIREHIYNAIILAVCKLPRTIGMVLLNLAPFLIFLISPIVFVQTLIFWVVIGFAFVSYIDCNILKPVFAELEKGNGTSIGIMN